MRHPVLGFLCAMNLVRVAGADDTAPLPLTPDTAREYFAEANRLCMTDDGRLWGVSLCGPMMFVQESTRTIVANQPDAQGLLRAERGLFVGTLPEDFVRAETSWEWAGVSWVQLTWPLHEDSVRRAALMMHQSFHRVREELDLPAPFESRNDHLDSLEGRFLLQLEWRALARALESPNDSESRQAARDAMDFRFARYLRFPAAEAAESVLELHEGLAEYTGVYLAGSTPADRAALALRVLNSHYQDRSFIRSFGHASGPAYGVLLDRYSPQWRKRFRDENFGVLLRQALGLQAVSIPREPLERRAARYDGVALLIAEEERAERKRKIELEWRARFVDGPVVELPLENQTVTFKPGTLDLLKGEGVIFPKARITDDWGVLEVTGGALRLRDRSAVRVSALDLSRDGPISGNGWTLVLKPGWRLVPAEFAGDWILEPER